MCKNFWKKPENWEVAVGLWVLLIWLILIEILI